MLDHIEAAISELEAARDTAQEMYSDTCSEVYQRTESIFQGKLIKAEVLTISDDGDSRFLLMVEMLGERIATLETILEKLEPIRQSNSLKTEAGQWN